MIDQLLTLGINGFESSEELLGAYLEDNLTVVDNLKIKQFVSEHPDFGELIDDITSTEIDWSGTLDNDILETIQLPNIEPTHIETLDLDESKRHSKKHL